MVNNLIHFEINVDDIDRAKRFYSKVFGWAFKDIPQMNYVLVYPGGVVTDSPAVEGLNGGMMQREDKTEECAPNAYVCTIWVEDMEDILEKIADYGGRVDSPINEVMGVGRMAYVLDSEMNRLSVMSPVERETWVR